MNEEARGQGAVSETLTGAAGAFSEFWEGEFAGDEISFDNLKTIGQELAAAVELTQEDVKKAYQGLATGTRESMAKVFKEQFKMDNSEVEVLFERLDFSSGEVAISLKQAIQAEEEMIDSTNRMRLAMLGGAASVIKMDSKIASFADQLAAQMDLVSEGFDKISKMLLNVRKSSVGGFSAMGVMNNRDADNSLIGFQEDVILQQAQIQTEVTLRELLTEVKDFNNRDLKDSYQDVTMQAAEDPTGFYGDRILDVLQRTDTNLLQSNQGIIDLNQKENEALQELQKINVSTALSLIELRTQTLAAQKGAERKALAKTTEPLTPENVGDINRLFGELFGVRGKATIPSEAEGFDRLKKFMTTVGERFGVNPAELQSSFFRDEQTRGKQFQRTFNTLNLVDELSEFGLVSKDIRKLLETAPPEATATRQGQRDFLMKQVFGNSDLANILPDVGLKPGQTIDDFFKTNIRGGDRVRDFVVDRYGLDANAARMKGGDAEQAFGAVVEILAKNLMGLVSASRVEKLSSKELASFQTKEEKGFLQGAINDLISSGKLEIKDIKAIFGDRVDDQGNITSTSKLGLNVVRSLVKDMAQVKGPEFQTLSRIKENTGRTASLLAEYFATLKRRDRIEESETQQKARDELQRPLFDNLRNTSSVSSQGFIENTPSRDPGKFLRDYQLPENSPLRGAFRIEGLKSSTSGKIPDIVPGIETVQNAETFKERGIPARGIGEGMDVITKRGDSTIPSFVLGARTDDTEAMMESIRLSRVRLFGRSKAPPTTEDDIGPALKDALTFQLDTALDIGAQKRQRAEGITDESQSFNLGSLSWFEKALPALKVGTKAQGYTVGEDMEALRNVVQPGSSLELDALAVLGKIIERGEFAGVEKDEAPTLVLLQKWMTQNMPDAPGMVARAVKDSGGELVVPQLIASLASQQQDIKAGRQTITGG